MPLADFYASIKPYRILAGFFSVQAVTRAKDGSYRRSWLQIATVITHVSVFSATMYFGVADNEKSKEPSDVYLTSFSMYIILTAIRFLGIYALSLKNASSEIKLYQNLDKIDSFLKTLGKSEELNKSNKVTRAATIKILLFSAFAQFVMEGFNYVIAYQSVTPLILGISFLPSYVGTLNKCYFFIWSSALKDRFEIINNSFRAVKKRSKLKQFSFSVYTFEKQLSQIMDLHQEAVAVSRMMNDIFEIEIVFHFSIIFNMIFANGYFTMFILTTRKQNIAVYPFTVVENMVFVSFEFYVLVYSSTRLCSEACDARNILIGIQMDIYDETSHRLVITSIYELNENKLEITACRLFNINYSTVFAMLSNIANYIFIMLQLESD